MIMYKTTRWNDSIDEREMTRVTDKSIFWISNKNECREAKVSKYYMWHETKQDAINHLFNKYKKEIEYAEKNLADAKEKIKELQIAYPNN